MWRTAAGLPVRIRFAVLSAIGYAPLPARTGASSSEASAEASRATDSSIASRSNFAWQS